MLSPKDAWHATLGQLQLQLNRSTFDTWLKGSEVLAYEDGEYVIRVRHAYAKDWLDQHLKTQILDSLSKILHRSVQVNFVVYLPNLQRLDPDDTGPLFANARDSLDSSQNSSLDNSLVKRTAELDTQTNDACWLGDYSEWDPRVTDIRRRTDSDLVPIHALPLSPRFTFETFVTGPSNQFAYAAAQAVVELAGHAL